MAEIQIFEAEFRLMELIWESAPIRSTMLVQLAGERLGWKKSTVFTVIKKLIGRGILLNENSMITPLVSREQVCLSESKSLIDRLFQGSSRLFLTNFLSKEEFTAEEAEELKQLIDQHTKP
ncbi:MAG: BlaI/MecI/CopY family transcriptional regulator [Candidatus Merdivicinus sp.]|jgi:BlaI family penicillinase repressor